MFPTDRGMCCSFNKQRAEDMFKEGKYRDSVAKFIKRDRETSLQNTEIPEWIPESGRQNGLTLMLDGHNDIVADSSVPDDFQASIQGQ